jgi:hypothetical protein
MAYRRELAGLHTWARFRRTARLHRSLAGTGECGFQGIPLVERLAERTCGVWVVHVETGETVGFLRFEAGVQEIFAVQVLHGVRYPELLEWSDPRLSDSYVVPDAALAEVAFTVGADAARHPLDVPIS